MIDTFVELASLNIKWLASDLFFCSVGSADNRVANIRSVICLVSSTAEWLGLTCDVVTWFRCQSLIFS